MKCIIENAKRDKRRGGRDGMVAPTLVARVGGGAVITSPDFSVAMLAGTEKTSISTGVFEALRSWLKYFSAECYH